MKLLREIAVSFKFVPCTVGLPPNSKTALNAAKENLGDESN
jgi:hypothetical protein